VVVWAVVLVVVKVAWPAVLVVPEMVVMVEVPAFLARVMVLPGIGLL
jgi:hypothetical protein